MAELPVLDLNRAVELAEQQVARMGHDFVYNRYSRNTPEGGCYYVKVQDVVAGPEDDPALHLTKEDSPKRKTGCLVGSMLVDAGVPYDALTSCFSVVDDPGPNETLAIINSYLSLSDNVLYFLTCLQRSQDLEQSWGDALDSALYALHYTEEN